MNTISNINYYINDYFILNNDIITHTLPNFKNNMNFESLDISNNKYNNSFSNYRIRFKNIINKNSDIGSSSILLNNDKKTKNIFFTHYKLYNDYQEAIKYEKRNLCKIFCIILVLKVKLINICFYNSPIELKSIKTCLVIFIYSCNFSLNTLFYFNNKISDKYHYKGNNLFIFTLLNNISICLISTLFSLIIVSLLTFLTNSKDKIINFLKGIGYMKSNNNKNNKKIIKDKKIINTFMNIFIELRKNITFFILIELMLLLFFFYFTTAFCEVYKKTQITWIIDCLTSFILSILSEILIAFLITIFYIVSVKKKSKILFCIIRLLL